MSSSSNLASELAFMDDSYEEQEEDEDMLLACVLVEKEERPKFYVKNRIAWEKHISGKNIFQS